MISWNMNYVYIIVGHNYYSFMNVSILFLLLFYLCTNSFSVYNSQMNILQISKNDLETNKYNIIILNSNKLLDTSLKFTEWKCDFGSVRYRTYCSHSFTFKNVSRASITIDNVSTSCSCAKTIYSSDSVLPGHYSTIQVTYRDSTMPGYFSQDAYISLKNGEKYTLRIKGTIREPGK